MQFAAPLTPHLRAPLIWRTQDADFLNRVANHPEVRPWLGPSAEPVDMAPEVSLPHNFAFQSAHGGIVFLERGAGLYEAHYHFLPECWGTEPRAALAEAVAEMFANADCEEIVVQVPQHNRRSLGLLKREGFHYRKDSANLFGDIPISIYGLTQLEWRQSCPG